MEVGKLSISAKTDYDGDTSFDVLISQGALQTHVHFWGDINCFEQFGEKLAAFPKSLEDVVQFEIGQIGFSYQNYLLFKAYCYDASGHSALKIITHNNEEEPQTQRVEFSISAEAAALNKLGNLLRSWQPNALPQFVWQAQIS